MMNFPLFGVTVKHSSDALFFIRINNFPRLINKSPKLAYLVFGAAQMMFTNEWTGEVMSCSVFRSVYLLRWSSADGISPRFPALNPE